MIKPIKLRRPLDQQVLFVGAIIFAAGLVCMLLPVLWIYKLPGQSNDASAETYLKVAQGFYLVGAYLVPVGVVILAIGLIWSLMRRFRKK